MISVAELRVDILVLDPIYRTKQYYFLLLSLEALVERPRFLLRWRRVPHARTRLLATKHKSGMMRMKQLSAASGVPKGTIQFYIKKGLIPRPYKTHANMAYYSDSHLNAIRLVKELQQKRFLPLSVIKQVVRGGRGGLSVDEIRALTEIDGKLFQNLAENPEVRPLTAKQLSEQTGVSLKDIKQMEKFQVLNPTKKGNRSLYGEDDIRLVECFAKMREAGFSEDMGWDGAVFSLYRDFLQRLVEEEAKILMSGVAGKVGVEKLTKMVEEGTVILNSMIGLIRKKLIVETVRRYSHDFQERVMMSEPSASITRKD
jgi:DNA-binding transcriptional MerR regulator